VLGSLSIAARTRDPSVFFSSPRHPFGPRVPVPCFVVPRRQLLGRSLSLDLLAHNCDGCPLSFIAIPLSVVVISLKQLLPFRASRCSQWQRGVLSRCSHCSPSLVASVSLHLSCLSGVAVLHPVVVPIPIVPLPPHPMSRGS
jgi:hypothetical protein